MYLCLSIVFLIILFDQIVKYVIESNMFIGQSVAILPNIFHLTYILNPGAAFGILTNQRYFFIIIAIFLLAIIIYFRKQILKMSKSLQIGIAMLSGGAVGNMIDRIFIGKVIDYIDFRVWPIFNLADVSIVLGCIIIIYKLLFTKEQEQE